MLISQFAGALDCNFQKKTAHQNVIYIDYYTMQMAWSHVTIAKIKISYLI